MGNELIDGSNATIEDLLVLYDQGYEFVIEDGHITSVCICE